MTDPAHPLHGKRFKVESVCRPPGGKSGHVFVTHEEGQTLRIPIQATNLGTGQVLQTRTKLNRQAVTDLLALFQRFQVPCPDQPDKSGGDSQSP